MNKLDKRKLIFFFLGNAAVGVGAVFIVIINIFALRGLAYIAVSVLAVIAGAFALYLLSSWAAVKKVSTYIGDPNDVSAMLNACKAGIGDYLRENKSTPFFRDKLSSISERIDTFSSRCDKIEAVIIGRFGFAGLSRGKFLAPVKALQEYLAGLASNLISRMNVFSEEEYSVRIAEFTKANRSADLREYEEVEREYKDYAENTLVAFDGAILKLDRLTLEVSKLSETETEKALNIMHDLDDLVKETRFYK